MEQSGVKRHEMHIKFWRNHIEERFEISNNLQEV